METTKTQLKNYNVTLFFQFPAWDEKEGILFPDITARSKSEAIKDARRDARDCGHLYGGKGRVWFRAVESVAMGAA